MVRCRWGCCESPKTLTDGAARRLRESFKAVHGGPYRAHELAVLEEGTSWEATGISPEASALIESRGFSVIEVARLLNLPPHKLQDYSQSHLANVEESNIDYLQSTLVGWLTALESEVNLKLFFLDEQGKLYAEHDVKALLRGNSVARADYCVKLKTAGIINADTAAAIENLPIPGEENGGQTYFVQSQNVAAQHAGKPQPKPGPAPKIPSVKPEVPPDDLEPDPEDPAEEGEGENEPVNGELTGATK